MIVSLRGKNAHSSAKVSGRRERAGRADRRQIADFRRMSGDLEREINTYQDLESGIHYPRIRLSDLRQGGESLGLDNLKLSARRAEGSTHDSAAWLWRKPSLLSIRSSCLTSEYQLRERAAEAARTGRARPASRDASRGRRVRSNELSRYRSEIRCGPCGQRRRVARLRPKLPNGVAMPCPSLQSSRFYAGPGQIVKRSAAGGTRMADGRVARATRRAFERLMSATRAKLFGGWLVSLRRNRPRRGGHTGDLSHILKTTPAVSTPPCDPDHLMVAIARNWRRSTSIRPGPRCRIEGRRRPWSRGRGAQSTGTRR